MLYRVFPLGLAPIILTILAAGLGYFLSWWSLAAIPFLWLGALCTAPNMNLADGCFSYVAMVAGLVLIVFSKPLGYAVFTGAASGYYLSALEKVIHMLATAENEDKADDQV